MLADGIAEAWDALVDLVLPAACAGCRGSHRPLRRGVCPKCMAAVDDLVPHAVRPVPAPTGLPPCVALGRYEGVLRELLLSYKERGRHGLAVPLGALLAQGVALRDGAPVLLVPVPDTARAARRRQGDHVSRLARHAVTKLRAAGQLAAVASLLQALPRPDSAGLDSAARAVAAAAAFRLRPGRAAARLRERVRASGARVVVVDDILTTGATAAAVTARLVDAGVPVRAVVVLAATVRRMSPR